jgi:ABC-type transporter Mla subunit MlaD
VSDVVSGPELGRLVQQLERHIDALRGEMREGFRGVNARLDTLNGQTRQHGERLAVAEAQYAAVVARLETHDDGIADVSTRHNTLAVTVTKQKEEFQLGLRQATRAATTEAVQDAVPSKKAVAGVGVGLVTVGAGIVELVRWLLSLPKGGSTP